MTTPRGFSSLLTLTRASVANFMDEQGLVQQAAIDAPRYEYSSVGALLGLLLEAATTNHALHCRDFTNAAWVKTNISAAVNAIGADGVSASASTLTASLANGTAFQSITLSSAKRTASFYVRRKTGTGTIEITDNGGSTYTDITGSINSTTYTRVSVTSTQANPSVGFRIVTSGDEIEVDFAQVEAGGIATSPIVTTTAGVARSADLVKATDVDIFDLTEGTIYIEGQVFADGNTAGADQLVFDLNDASASDSVRIILPSGTSQIRGEIKVGGSGVVTINGSYTEGAVFKAAFAYASGNSELALGGASVGTDATAFTLAGLGITQFDLGKDGAAANALLRGAIKTLRYYPRRLTSQELIDLTG